VGTQLSLAELIQDIAKGELILPEFQRGCVRTRTQVREYPARLIADIVTGKLDVRAVELPALDEDEPLERRDEAEELEVDEIADEPETENVCSDATEPEG
jgi:hypothetical protein